MKNKWINRSKKKVTQRSSDKVIRLFPSYKEGLTADQVKERIEKVQQIIQSIPHSKQISKSYWKTYLRISI